MAPDGQYYSGVWYWEAYGAGFHTTTLSSSGDMSWSFTYIGQKNWALALRGYQYAVVPTNATATVSVETGLEFSDVRNKDCGTQWYLRYVPQGFTTIHTNWSTSTSHPGPPTPSPPATGHWGGSYYSYVFGLNC